MSSDGQRELIEADPETGTFRTTYGYPSNPPSAAIATALVAVTDEALTDLDPMYEVTSVDPDALDDLFRPATSGQPRWGRVTFTYHDFEITVKDYGRIVIRSLDAG